MLHRQPSITLEIKGWDLKAIRTYFFFIFSLKPERLEEERISSSREFHKATEDGIQVGDRAWVVRLYGEIIPEL